METPDHPLGRVYAMRGEQQDVIVGGLVADMKILEEHTIPAVHARVDSFAKRVEDHEEADKLRHVEMLEAFKDLRTDIKDGLKSVRSDVADLRKQTPSAWLADTVTIPKLGQVKLRTLFLLGVFGYGMSKWLGVDGPTVWQTALDWWNS